jgi:hypothetical protein
MVTVHPNDYEPFILMVMVTLYLEVIVEIYIYLIFYFVK